MKSPMATVKILLPPLKKETNKKKIHSELANMSQIDVLSRAQALVEAEAGEV